MKEISVIQSFELFITTLNWLDQRHLELNDEELLTIILQELDIDAISFLHSFTINRLVDSNMIPASIVDRTSMLRERVIKLIESKGTAAEIRNDKEWVEARRLAHEIRADVNFHSR